MAGAYVVCTSYGNAYGCASAKASSRAWITAYARGLATAWADAWAGDGCCQNTAVASAEGLATLQVELLAQATADAEVSACVAGARVLTYGVELNATLSSVLHARGPVGMESLDRTLACGLDDSPLFVALCCLPIECRNLLLGLAHAMLCLCSGRSTP
jgi:hypothetical protein